jgi:heme/copper-type cytochrome/quinol oxidase subunit 2
MVRSKISKQNFLKLMLLEMLMVLIVTFLGTGLFFMFVMLKTDTRNEKNNFEYFIENPFVLVPICLIPAIICIIYIAIVKNKQFIVGFEIDRNSKTFKFEYRNLFSKKINFLSFQFDQVTINPFFDKNLLFVYGLKGIRFDSKSSNLSLFFISNNFIWEEQVNDKRYFLTEIEFIENEMNNTIQP